MKKIILLTLLICTNFLINAQCKPCDAKTFDFNKDGKTEGWNFNDLNDNSVEVKDGIYIYTLDGTQKSPNIRRSHITSAAHKYFHIVLKNESNADEIRLNFKDENNKTVFLDPILISTKDTEYKTYTLNPGVHELWTSLDTGINFRFSVNSKRSTPVKGTISIDKIVADNNPTLED